MTSILDKYKNQDELVDSFVEIKLNDPEDFLVIKETLTRIGIASKKDKKLFQSCHILQKRGKYYLVHFLELFALDGRETTFTDADLARRNTIAGLLHEWELCDVVDEDKIDDPTIPLSRIKILPFGEKKDWELIPKYSIGKVH